ncbi:MAG: ATP-binding protein [Phycisphaerales bacterium]
MINKPLDSIAQADVDALIAEQVSERRTLEFKAALPGNSDDEKREFLADVSSFANSAGGDLLYGVAATDGVPTEARGLAGVNEDAEKLRLEAVIRDGLKPRVPPIHVRFIPGFAVGPVLLIRVPRSVAAPHMVIFKNLSRFFARSSAGKWQLDVDELRSAFAAGPDLAERMRTWHRNRVAIIASDQGPVPVVSGAKLVVHLMPFGAFRERVDVGVEPLAARWNCFSPIGHPLVERRYNIDGILGTAGGENGRPGTRSYCQVFRDGRVEAVLGDVVREVENIPAIGSQWIERVLVQGCESIKQGLAELGTEFPVTVAASLAGARGAYLWVGRGRFDMDDVRPIDREVVALPEAMFTEVTALTDVVLKPTIDGLWNACGLAKSWHYGADGRWNPR